MESNTGRSLMTLLAKIMPEDEVLDQLQEALTTYKLTKTKETKSKLEMHLMLAATNLLTTEKSTEEVMDDMEKTSMALNLLDDKTKITS